MMPLPITGWTAIAAGLMCLTLVVVSALGARSSGRSAPGFEDSSQQSQGWLLHAPLLPLVLAVVVGLVSLYSLLLLLAFGAESFKLPDTANAANPVLVGATLIAGALTAAYAVLRLRAHLLAETHSKLEAFGDRRAAERHRSDQEAALVERFSRAVSLLSADQAISRIAGAHLVLALGDEWPSGAQRCLDVLISHLRGLRENPAIEDETVPRGVREEVRLITSEICRRLSGGTAGWIVRAGDFSGTALDGVDLQSAAQVTSLDFSGALILGDLSIPAASSGEAPLLADLCCHGDLLIECSPDWEALDLSRSVVDGSVRLSGKSAGLAAPGLRAGGSLDLLFSTFPVDVVLDGVNVEGEVRVGLPSLGAAFGDGAEPVELSLVDATFARLSLQRLTCGPRLNLSGARGFVDLTSSVFPFEVDASHLDASAGLHLRSARFDDALILDGAKVPAIIDVDGLVLSDAARSAIQSADPELRDRLLETSQVRSPSPSPADGGFDWRLVVEPFRDRAGAQLMSALEGRFTAVETNLPLDWRNKQSFAAEVASEVARAFATVDAPAGLEGEVQSAFRRFIRPELTSSRSK